MIRFAIWAGLFSTQLLFLVITGITVPGGFDLMFRPDLSQLYNETAASSLWMLGVVAVVNFVLATFFFPNVERKARTQMAGASEAAIEQKLFGWYVVRLAMLESVTLFGFVLAQALKQPAAILPFFFLALVGFVLAMPRLPRRL